MGRWVEREHTADALLTVWGDDLADLFITAARATFALIAPWGEGEPVVVRITLSAPDVETLLVDWLNDCSTTPKGSRCAPSTPSGSIASRSASWRPPSRGGRWRAGAPASRRRPSTT